MFSNVIEPKMRAKRRVFLAVVSNSWRKQVQEKLFLFIISSARKCACAWDIDDGKTRPAECVSLYSLRDRQFSLSCIYSWSLRPPRTHARKLIDFALDGQVLIRIFGRYELFTSAADGMPASHSLEPVTSDVVVWQFSAAVGSKISTPREKTIEIEGRYTER